MPFLERENFVETFEQISKLMHLQGKFVREEGSIFWDLDGYSHGQILRMSNLSNPVDAGFIGAIPSRRWLIIHDRSSSLRLPIDQQERIKTLDMATAWANGTGIIIKDSLSLY